MATESLADPRREPGAARRPLEGTRQKSRQDGQARRDHLARGPLVRQPPQQVADRLAKSSAGNAVRPPLAHVKVRRKKSSRQEERGSVALTGQRMTIRIITDQWLPVQKMFVYKYEVVSQRSQYCGFVDRIFSEHLLSAGHTYSVRVNDDSKRPWITKMFREV